MMITDVLRLEPSVKVVHDSVGPESHAVFRRSIGISVSNVCSPLLVLDGFRLSSPAPKIDELVHPNDVEAIELYPGSHGAPGRFLNPCGVIMIWTKRGR